MYFLNVIIDLDFRSFNIYKSIFVQDAQSSYGFDRSAVEGESNKYFSKKFNNDRINLPKNTIISYSLEDDIDTRGKSPIIEYSLEDEYGIEGSGSTKVTPFNKDSVQKVPQESYTNANEYYGAAAKIGRKLDADYYGKTSFQSYHHYQFCGPNCLSDMPISNFRRSIISQSKSCQYR